MVNRQRALQARNCACRDSEETVKVASAYGHFILLIVAVASIVRKPCSGAVCCKLK